MAAGAVTTGLEEPIDPESDYVWRDGRYEYVRRPLPVKGRKRKDLSRVPKWAICASLGP